MKNQKYNPLKSPSFWLTTLSMLVCMFAAIEGAHYLSNKIFPRPETDIVEASFFLLSLLIFIIPLAYLGRKAGLYDAFKRKEKEVEAKNKIKERDR